MSNLNNAYSSCPALMSDGRSSIITDYRTKNDAFKSNIGSSTNSYDFRNKLQKNGLSNMTEDTKINQCSTVPFGNIVISKEIKLQIDTSGNLKDAFKLLR